MVIATSVPSPVFGPLGFQIPATSAILTGVLTDMNAAYGGNMNLNLNTPQGQQASSLTACIDNANSIFLNITNQFDPALSSGRWQDGIGYIYFIVRNPALSTVVAVTITGKVGTVIPVDALAADTSGALYANLGAVTIGGGGSVAASFANTVPGPLPCPAGTLTGIYQTIPGWDTINNPSDGAVGNYAETPQQFEQRRAQSVAKNSMGPSAAVQGAVLSVPGVLDAYTYDNSTNSPVTIQGQTIAANSLYCCVAGGASADIALAIWQHKAPGCSYTGTTTVTVTDLNSDYAVPQPTYPVSFQRPSARATYFLVTIKNSTLVPANALSLIQSAMLATFAGTETDANFNTFSTRARIGGTIFATDYFPNIALLGSWARVVSISVGNLTASTAAVFTASIAGTNMTVTAVASGTLAPGQALRASGAVIAGARIVSQSSGTTGSTGVYVIDLGQTVASQSITTINVNLPDLTLQINEFPTLVAANVYLALV